MAYQIETSLTPFWAESKDFVTGRDPLGIQNSSVSIYAALLPGLNNVTDRLRYYGFYCWLLKEIEDQKLTFDSPRAQYNFIRKAEYTLALYMAEYEPAEQGIAGSAYAIRKIKEAKENGTNIVDVATGAEKHKGTIKGSVYWDFTAGILGQYYAGSLQNSYSGLGLISIKERYYFITDAGRQLGIAFGGTISSPAAIQFFNIINAGFIDLAKANILVDFSISRIQADSQEGIFYRDMFFSTDFSLRPDVREQSRFRKDSLLMLLDFLAISNEERAFNYFPESIYKQSGFIGTAHESPASIGWFYYMTCERMHISLEHMFYTILLHIQQGAELVDDTVNTLTSFCMASMSEYYEEFSHDMSLDSLIAILEEEQEINYSEEIRNFQRSSPGDAVVYSLEYFLTTYKNTVQFRSQFVDFANRTQTRDKNGTALDWMLYIEKHKTISVEQFFKRLLLKIINDHLHVAYAKQGSGEQQVHKFLLEDNFLIHINNIDPRFTTPRLRSARNFLRDMKIISFNEIEGYAISEVNADILSSYKQALV